VSTTRRNGEVILGMRARRRFTTEEKIAIVQESGQVGNSLSATARRHGVHPSQVYTWRRLMSDGQVEAISSEEKVFPESELKALKKRIHELERILGRKTLEAEILKEAVTIGREKKLISREPLRGLEDFK
jgi:transposase